MARGFIIGGGTGGVDCDSASANRADIRSGKTAGIAGYDDIVVGTMPETYGATLTPGANEQRLVGNKYLLSDIVVPGFAMPASNIIQWGTYVTIYNRTVIGTYEGFHVGNKWIYNHGNVPADNQNFTVLTGINSGISLGTGGGNSIKISFRRTYTGYKQIVIKGTLFGSYGVSAQAQLSVGNKTITFTPNGYTDTAIVIPIPDVGYHGYWSTTIYVPIPTAQAYIDEIYLE